MLSKWTHRSLIAAHNVNNMLAPSPIAPYHHVLPQLPQVVLRRGYHNISSTSCEDILKVFHRKHGLCFFRGDHTSRRRASQETHTFSFSHSRDRCRTRELQRVPQGKEPSRKRLAPVFCFHAPLTLTPRSEDRTLAIDTEVQYIATMMSPLSSGMEGSAASVAQCGTSALAEGLPALLKVLQTVATIHPFLQRTLTPTSDQLK